jgi:hypothetical protein
MPVIRPCSATRQVAGVDDLFNEKLRIVIEYMHFRELPADLKRKVPASGAPPTRIKRWCSECNSRVALSEARDRDHANEGRFVQPHPPRRACRRVNECPAAISPVSGAGPELLHALLAPLAAAVRRAANPRGSERAAPHTDPPPNRLPDAGRAPDLAGAD